MDQAPAGNILHPIQIRMARPEDHPAVCALFSDGVIEGHVRDNDTGADIDNLQEGYFSDGGASSFWVALLDADVIGMIGVQRTSDDVAEVRRLRVHERFRRLGVGTRLMEQALHFCRERGYLKVVLDVRIDRGPAIALFEKFGFKLNRVRDVNRRKMLDFLLDLYSDQGPE
jgi:ribosomal protein S18 acetylase RimI-like enzyme